MQLRRLDGAAHEMQTQFKRAIWYIDRSINDVNAPNALHDPNFRDARYCVDGALAEWHWIKKYFV